MIRATRSVWSFVLAGALLLLGISPLMGAAATAVTPPALEKSAEAQQLNTIPLGKGLPVVVRTGLFFNHIEAFDDNKSTFEATTDLRMSWHDPRLRYPVEQGLNGYKEYRVSAAEEQLAKIWTPPVRFANRIGDPTFTERRLRIYPDGRVETIARTTAVYKTPVNVTRFPFDHQALEIELLIREDTVESVDFDYTSDDVEFSKVAKRVELGGWTTGLVHLKRELIAGWNGDRYAKVRVTLDVKRDAVGTIATIFIPLFASLLIPFLATWMNRAEGDGFEVEGFELANVIIGGLFAVIALGFTINSAFPLLAQSDNTVSRLLGLNYTALAVGLIITVAFYRYKLPARFFGAYVQEQMFVFLTWAFPVVFIAVGLGFVAIAAA